MSILFVTFVLLSIILNRKKMIKLFWKSIVIISSIMLAFKNFRIYVKNVIKYVIHMSYEWTIISILFCMYANILYPNWQYGDHLWILPIASLLIILLVNALTEEQYHPRHPHFKNEQI